MSSLRKIRNALAEKGWSGGPSEAPSAREVARTIVHEASHKWAFTTDVLYKHWGFAGTDDMKKNPDRKIDANVHHPSQEMIVIPGRARFLLPMMEFESDRPNELITTERWLENADSYAWFARRMFKRRTTL